MTPPCKLISVRITRLVQELQHKAGVTYSSGLGQPPLTFPWWEPRLLGPYKLCTPSREGAGWGVGLRQGDQRHNSAAELRSSKKS